MSQRIAGGGLTITGGGGPIYSRGNGQLRLIGPCIGREIASQWPKAQYFLSNHRRQDCRKPPKRVHIISNPMQRFQGWLR